MRRLELSSLKKTSSLLTLTISLSCSRTQVNQYPTADLNSNQARPSQHQAGVSTPADQQKPNDSKTEEFLTVNAIERDADNIILKQESEETGLVIEEPTTAPNPSPKEVDDEQVDSIEVALVTGKDPNPTAPIGKDHENVATIANSNGKFLKQVENLRYRQWVDYFSNRDKDRFERFVANGQKYKGLIEKILAEHKLPKELFFVGLIESGYYLRAKSRAAAVGPWQFIRATGRRYGLKVGRAVDERRDIFKATHAAALYFKDLYNIFGSWELALSAYNAGEYGVIKRIRRANTRDFYELIKKRALPRETMNYVPKVLAAMHVYNNHQKYAVHIPKPTNPYSGTKTIHIKRATSLGTVARQIGVSSRIIKGLNPDLSTYHVPRYRSGFVLRVPANANVSHELLAEVNSTIKSRKPRTKRNSFRTRKRRKIVRTKSRSNRPIVYKVKRGDTLLRIALMAKTSIRKLKRFNGMKSNVVRIGQRIRLPETNRQYYRVRRGDSLGKIARHVGVPTWKIKRLNALSSNTIIPGQRLVYDSRL